MYPLDGQRLWKSLGKPRPKVSRAVWSLGFTSLFTDISSEMVSSILPMYLLGQLRLDPLQFGFLDGLYQGVTALSRLGAGFLADLTKRHKEVALAGYSVSAVCKLGLLWAGDAWGAIAAILALDRTGKGVRTAPRDALISLHSQEGNTAASFGVHRALDAVGALVGPAMAFVILSRAPGAYDIVFVVSFCLALVGLGVLACFVQNRRVDTLTEPVPDRVSWTAVLKLLGEKRFRTLMIVGGLLSLVTLSDSFVYLGLQDRMRISAPFFPLLYLGTTLFNATLAAPIGHLADRVGRRFVFIGGYVLLLAVYSAPLISNFGAVGLVAYLGLFGVYYAATDGVLMAMAAQALPRHLYGSGMALLGTAVSLCKILTSVGAGWLWTRGGSALTAEIFLIGLVIGIGICAWKLSPSS